MCRIPYTPSPLIHWLAYRYCSYYIRNLQSIKNIGWFTVGGAAYGKSAKCSPWFPSTSVALTLTNYKLTLLQTQNCPLGPCFLLQKFADYSTILHPSPLKYLHNRSPRSQAETVPRAASMRPSVEHRNAR